MLFGQIMPQKIVFGYSRYKRTPFRPVKGSFERVEKIEIFEKGLLVHGFCQKIDPFTMSALWANQARKDSI